MCQNLPHLPKIVRILIRRSQMSFQRPEDDYLLMQLITVTNIFRAMMSGDSPENCNRTDPLLELKDRPVACTSNGTPAGKLAGETVTASVLVEPQPKPTDPAGILAGATILPEDETSVPKRSRSTSTDDDTIETAATPLTNKKLDNGAPDIIDGDPTKLMNNVQEKKVQEDEEEEECGVKCLYYTLQCCECTIM